MSFSFSFFFREEEEEKKMKMVFQEILLYFGWALIVSTVFNLIFYSVGLPIVFWWCTLLCWGFFCKRGYDHHKQNLLYRPFTIKL